MKTPSRERLWQLKQKASGNCQCCAQPSQGRSYCDTCSKRHGHAYRKPIKSTWAAVDWNQPNASIASTFNVTVSAVHYQRKKHSQDTPPTP